MTLLSESEAAKATGLTRFAIRRHLKNGQLSANNGLIDNSELIRVFGPQLSNTEPVYGTSRHPESALLKYKLTEIENTLANERLLLDEVRQDRDFWCRQAGLEESGQTHRDHRAPGAKRPDAGLTSTASTF